MYNGKGDLLGFSCFRSMLEIYMYWEVIPGKQFSVGEMFWCCYYITVWLI